MVSKRHSILYQIIIICLLTISISSSFLIVVNADEIDYVYLGGQVIGIDIKLNGLSIVSKVNIISKEGCFSPFKDIELFQGDILYSIDDVLIENISQIDDIIQNKEFVNICIKRNNNLYSYSVTPKYDLISRKNKLGLLLKDQLSGIGTITYINPKDMSFAALGHPIKDYNGENIIGRHGVIYSALVTRVVKSSKNHPGELIGSFSHLNNPIGTITDSNMFGIFGNLNNNEQNLIKIEMGKKEDIKTGKAQIYSTVSGEYPQLYDIEILNIDNSNSKEKCMFIKIVDENLISKTGGIVQGMSGSPIIQNGKLIGAITHVLVSDSTKGYGIFIDLMT